jgi:hypothetical protein
MKVYVYSFGFILYEMIVGDGLFSSAGNKMPLFRDITRGWRPEIPVGVIPVSKSLIENCWSEDPSKRPSFDEIWRILKNCDFEILNGVKKAEIDSFLGWVEGHGIKLDR